MKLTIKEETWPYIDRYFKAVPEDMLKLPTFREALEESQREGEKRGKSFTLLRLLEHKFGPVPAPLRQQVESCNDSEQLDRWLDQTLAATTPLTLLPVRDDSGAA